MSPALAGEFFTTEPPEKPYFLIFNMKFFICAEMVQEYNELLHTFKKRTVFSFHFTYSGPYFICMCADY